jgi:hypothetical protein
MEKFFKNKIKYNTAFLLYSRQENFDWFDTLLLYSCF